MERLGGNAWGEFCHGIVKFLNHLVRRAGLPPASKGGTGPPETKEGLRTPQSWTASRF